MPQQQKKWFERTHQGCYYISLRYFLHFNIGIIENQLLSSNPYWLRLSLRLYSVNKYRIDRKHRWILRLYVRLYFLTFHYCRNNHWCRFLADTNLSAPIPEIIGVGFRDYRCWFTTNNWHLWGICEIINCRDGSINPVHMRCSGCLKSKSKSHNSQSKSRMISVRATINVKKRIQSATYPRQTSMNLICLHLQTTQDQTIANFSSDTQAHNHPTIGSKLLQIGNPGTVQLVTTSVRLDQCNRWEEKGRQASSS